jgi:hypothetical protein
MGGLCASESGFAAQCVAPVAGRRWLSGTTAQNRLARYWQAAFAEHPSAGHDLPLDDGAWVAGQVAQWSRNLPPPT